MPPLPFLYLIINLCLLKVCLALAISDPQCAARISQLLSTNPSLGFDLNHVPVSVCIRECGAAPSFYGIWIIQKRVASWVVPLFILIGMNQFAPLGLRNIVKVVTHMLGDPFNTITSLLWKLHNTREYYVLCQSSRLPVEAAIILSAYEDWENVWCYVNHQTPLSSRREDRIKEFTEWLEYEKPARLSICLGVANELADCRAPGLWKTALGALNYVVAVALAFLHILTGEVSDPAIGYIIAIPMLYSWLIPAIVLSSFVGAFQTKRSSARILRQLPKKLITTMVAADKTISTVFPGHLDAGARLEDYGSLEWCGGNYSFSPRQFSQGRKRKTLVIAAAIPVILSISGAAFIAYSVPPRGVGYRSVLQFSFLSSWIISAFLTYAIRRWVADACSQWRWTFTKDAIVVGPQFIALSAAIIGWFNSCFCWSSPFSLRLAAYVVLKPLVEDLRLSKHQWPLLTGAMLFGHFLFLWTVWVVYRQAICLYRYNGEPKVHLYHQVGEADV